MKNILFLIIILFQTYNVKAQITINGKITEKKQEVSFATVIFSIDKQKISKMADENGNFKLEIPKSGQYHLKISEISHQDIDTTLQISKNMILNLEMKSKENLLKGVEVQAKKAPITRKIDRLVMDVKDNPIAAGKSSLEVMSIAPGVFVRDGQISINGNGGAKVMVNGKILPLSGDALTNYLNNLKAENIASIEVIAHPPAEYDAQGAGGLINIVLKKNRQGGINGSVNAGFRQGKYASTNEGISLNYNKNKLTLSADYSFNKDKSFNNIYQKRAFPNEGIYTAENLGVNRYNGHKIHTAATYDIDTTQYIGAEYTFDTGFGDNMFKANALIAYPNKANNSVAVGQYPNNFDYQYQNIGVNYHITTNKKGSDLTFLADATFNKSNTESSASSITTTQNQQVDTAYGNNTPSDAQIFTADLRYKNVFNAKHQLSFGGKITHTEINNQAYFQNRTDGVFVNDEHQNFEYDYRENIAAAYINYTGNIWNTEVQLGLRAENTSLVGTLYKKDSLNKNPNAYFNLFPSVFLKKNVNATGDNYLSLVYNRRLNRPSFDNLNPNISYIDNYSSGQGNPFLQPEFTDNMELGFTLKSKYIFSLNYTNTQGVIYNIVRPDSKNPTFFTQIPSNSGVASNYMVQAVIPIQMYKWWNMQNTLQFNYMDVNSPNFRIRQKYLFAQTSQQFTITKTLTANINAFYFSKFLFANAILNSFSTVDVGFQQKMLDNKLLINIFMNDVFGKQSVNSGRFYYTGLDLSFSQRQQKQKAGISLTYNFNLGKTFKMKKLESSSDDVKNRLGK